MSSYRPQAAVNLHAHFLPMRMACSSVEVEHGDSFMVNLFDQGLASECISLDPSHEVRDAARAGKIVDVLNYAAQALTLAFDDDPESLRQFSCPVFSRDHGGPCAKQPCGFDPFEIGSFYILPGAGSKQLCHQCPAANNKESVWRINFPGKKKQQTGSGLLRTGESVELNYVVGEIKER